MMTRDWRAEIAPVEPAVVAAARERIDNLTKPVRSRTIPLAPLVLTALRNRRQAYREERIAARAQYEDGGYVIADPLGRRLTP